jgi:hypothetical protein
MREALRWALKHHNDAKRHERLAEEAEADCAEMVKKLTQDELAQYVEMTSGADAHELGLK